MRNYSKTGKIVFLLAIDPDIGGYGPPGDSLNVEAVFILNAIDDGAYGIKLRNEKELPARQAMFSLLRDAFVNDLTVIVDYQIAPGKHNGYAIRVALIRETKIIPIPPHFPPPVPRPNPRQAATTARSKPKPRKVR
jgi:hypothetical protein